MPYCNQCGAFVLDEDRFCPKCGRTQQAESAERAPASPSAEPAEAHEAPAEAHEAPAEARAAPAEAQAASVSSEPAAAAQAAIPPSSSEAPESSETARAQAPPPPPPPSPPRAEAPETGGGPSVSEVYPVPPNIAAMLCYLPGMGWIAAIILLALDSYRNHRYVRFHAFQGLFLAVIWLLVQKFFFPFDLGNVHIFPFVGFRKIWQLAVIVAQVVGMIKTIQSHKYRLPVLGDLAEKSLA